MCVEIKPTYLCDTFLLIDQKSPVVDLIKRLLSYVVRKNLTVAQERGVRIANLVSLVCEACVAFGKNTFHPHEEGFGYFQVSSVQIGYDRWMIVCLQEVYHLVMIGRM